MCFDLLVSSAIQSNQSKAANVHKRSGNALDRAFWLAAGSDPGCTMLIFVFWRTTVRQTGNAKKDGSGDPSYGGSWWPKIQSSLSSLGPRPE